MKKEITLNDIMTALHDFTTTINERFTKMDNRLAKLETTTRDGFQLIEKKFEGRLAITDNRLQVVKNTIEHDLKTKVPW